MSDIILSTNLPLTLLARGKVRDIYEVGDYLLIVATDRISAFDAVLPDGIPSKGHVLNQLSGFWFRKTNKIINNHLVATLDSPDDLKKYLPEGARAEYLLGRSMITRKAEKIPVEFVVRGYLAGSAWSEYQKTGSIFGYSVPPGLKNSERLPTPILTPTTKAEFGHDQPLKISDVEEMLGQKLAKYIEEKSLELYQFAHEFCLDRGFIIADTKFEFGIIDDECILIDELLTPDSSRFWDLSSYQVGRPQDSFDKQPVRDWLEKSGWNKEPPAPPLPPEVIKELARRYQLVSQRLIS
jgi:phosphoribosylaminoimidazole-succinocarboxamide synthase